MTNRVRGGDQRPAPLFRPLKKRAGMRALLEGERARGTAMLLDPKLAGGFCVPSWSNSKARLQAKGKRAQSGQRPLFCRRATKRLLLVTLNAVGWWHATTLSGFARDHDLEGRDR